MKVLVTGANGFVGRALCMHLAQHGCEVVKSARKAEFEGFFIVGNVDEMTNWKSALLDCDSVVHLAARVHVMNDDGLNPLDEYRRVNVDGSVNLARQAAAAGVQRFVYLSSVKVNGEFTEAAPFSETDDPVPIGPYAVSKYEAEVALRQVAKETGMDVVILRPPLIYGEGVRANFGSMMNWLDRGVPLPLAAVTKNRRSLVALDNLVDLIRVCISHRNAANQTFLVSDGEDLSTACLLRRLGSAMGIRVLLFYVPMNLLERGARLIRKLGVYQRLCGSLQVDISKAQQLLDWVPPVSVDEALLRTAQGRTR